MEINKLLSLDLSRRKRREACDRHNWQWDVNNFIMSKNNDNYAFTIDWLQGYLDERVPFNLNPWETVYAENLFQLRKNETLIFEWGNAIKNISQLTFDSNNALYAIIEKNEYISELYENIPYLSKDWKEIEWFDHIKIEKYLFFNEKLVVFWKFFNKYVCKIQWEKQLCFDEITDICDLNWKWFSYLAKNDNGEKFFISNNEEKIDIEKYLWITKKNVKLWYSPDKSTPYFFITEDWWVMNKLLFKWNELVVESRNINFHWWYDETDPDSIVYTYDNTVLSIKWKKYYWIPKDMKIKEVDVSRNWKYYAVVYEDVYKKQYIFSSKEWLLDPINDLGFHEIENIKISDDWTDIYYIWRKKQFPEELSYRWNMFIVKNNSIIYKTIWVECDYIWSFKVLVDGTIISARERWWGWWECRRLLIKDNIIVEKIFINDEWKYILDEETNLAKIRFSLEWYWSDFIEEERYINIGGKKFNKNILFKERVTELKKT